ncbi:helix-turn-helix transcriptional regulator [Ulvibacterium sp.]|uniref:helix-turn-helix transcriptional regulator n=1 Tax=Ulvibacterium sp. TaxID=2665914 RepID=UPI003BAA157D
MKLLERESEISLLQEYAKDCIDQKSSIINIYGEAGIGKTSLVDYFLNSLGDDFCICRGYCESLFTPRPFGPVYDMRAELGVNFPESLNSENKNVIFERLRKGILIKEQPVVLLFEDVHWADEATLDLIKFLGRRIEQFQCMLVLTHRDNELAKGHPLYKILAELSTKRLKRLKVSAFSEDTVLKLATDHDLSGERLYKLTKGNPFFVFELLKTRKLQVSDNLKEIIVSGLTNVSPSENEVLSLISVFPQKAEIDIIEQITTLSDVGKYLDGLVGKKLINTDGISVYFKHDLVRLAIYDAIYPLEKMNFHKKILGVLLKDFETRAATLSEIVHHAIKSRNLDIIRKYAPKAASEASTWGAHVQAFNLYKIAIENIEEKHTATHAALLEAYSHECYLTNQLKEGTEAAQTLIDIWSSVDKVKEGNAYALSSRLLWFSGLGKQGLLHGRKAIEILEEHAPMTISLANAYAHNGHILALSFKLKEAYLWNGKALSLSEKLKERKILAFAASNISLLDIHSSLDSYKNGLGNLKKSLDIGLEIEDQGLVGRIYVNLYFNYVLTGNIQVANSIIGEIKRFFIDNDLDLFFYVVKSLESLLFRFKGEWPVALKIANETLQSEHNNQYTRVVAILSKAIIETRIGSPDTLEFLKKGCQLAMESKEYQFVVPMAAAVLEYEWIKGEEFPDRSIVDLSVELCKMHDSIWYDALLNFWLNKRGLPSITKTGWKRTDFVKYLDDLKEVILTWSKSIGYYQALTLMDGDTVSQKKAFDILEGLGAEAVISRIKKSLREKGVKSIPRGIRSSTRNNPEQLTNRQLEILHLLKEGMTNLEIADKLFISTRTVDNHVSAILDKLNSETRAKAVLVASEKGILS